MLAPALLLCCMAALSGCGSERSGGRIKVAVDIYPLADFCRRVGGERVEVEAMVPPGASPHTYELTAAQMRYLSEADLLVVNGLGLTPWAEDMLARAGNPGAPVLKAGEAIPESQLLAPPGEEREGAGAEETVHDPHVWLDPRLAMEMVEAIGEAMASVDPDNAGAYREGAEVFVRELERLDEEIAETASSFGHREFISFHSTWTYFARRYGLELVGVVEELPGKEPSLGEVASLVRLAESRGVRAIFAEPQLNYRVAETVAEESGGRVGVYVLDPLGDPSHPERGDYLSLMRYNLEVMRQAMR